jgi:hypothetical protein
MEPESLSGKTLSTIGPAGIVWRGIPYLLTVFADMAEKLQLSLLVADLNNYVTEKADEKLCLDRFHLVRRVYNMETHDQEQWITIATPLELVIVHQALTLVKHVAGVQRNAFDEILDSINMEFAERVTADARKRNPAAAKEAKLVFDYHFTDPDVFIYSQGGDIDLLLKIKELEKTVPYVVRSMVTRFFQDTN